MRSHPPALAPSVNEPGFRRRRGNVAPVLDLESAGATRTLCANTRSPNHFETMRLATMSARLRGAAFEPKARKVLGWSTANPGAALGLSSQIGSLEAGKKTDLILLDATLPNLTPVLDPYGIVVHSACSAKSTRLSSTVRS